jgi:hypothetical protein
MGYMKNAYKIVVGKKGRDQSEDLGMHGKEILKWILRD